MKRYQKPQSIKSVLVILFFLIVSAAGPAFGAASSGYSEYYIPGDEDHMRTVLNDIAYNDLSASKMHVIISVTAWSANTTVYYDHWENGYNFDPDQPVSTADETYNIATRGGVKIFEESNIPLPRASNLYSNPPTNTTYYHDGRDRIYVAGGSATVARASWTESAGTLLAVSWEVYPVRPQLTTYIMPFGEDLARDATKNYWDFDRVYNLVQATADGTVVQVDLDKDGVYDDLDWNRDGSIDGTSYTLNKGDVLLLDRVTMGDQAINGATVNGSTDDNLLIAGTRIEASSTIQVQYVVGDQYSAYEVRGLSAFPRGFWDTEYYAPVHGATPANKGYTNIYLYNPNNTALTINYQTNAGSGTFSIPSKSTLSYYQGTGGYVPQTSAVYLKGSGVFWGISIIDTSEGRADSNSTQGSGNQHHVGSTHDWGYSLVPAFLLDNEHFLGWAPGSYPVGAAAGTNDPDTNSKSDSGVYISPAQDHIRVYVDYDPSDATPYDVFYDLGRLDSQYVYDTTDGDMTNANIYATGPYTAAYGQNPDLSPPPKPAIDVGYTTIPSNDFIDMVLRVDKSVNPAMLPTGTGQQTTFTLEVDTGKYPVDGISVVDDLPTGWAYLTNTTTITLPNGSTDTTNPTVTGSGPYTLTWNSSVLGSMAPNQKLYITYDAQATGTFSAADLSKNNVTAVGTRTVEGVTQTFTTSDFAFITYGDGILDIAKTSDVTSTAYPGDTINYTVTITNSGTAPLTNISVYDPMPNGVSYVPSSAVVSAPGSVIRVTEYYINTGFTGTTYNLTLDQDLSSDYFVIVRGADSDGGTTTGPNVNYAALTADPFSTGDLGDSGAADQITLTRGGNYNGWVGVVTVVECLGDPTGNGFTLRSVNRVAHTGTAASGTTTTTTAWTNINQVMLMGGFYGPGCNTAETSSTNSVSCFARIWPTGTNTINWTRDAGTATLATSTSTVMVLEWGSAWTVQRANVTGSNGGPDADDTSEYNIASISSVARANTWVWGTGTANLNGLGTGAEGVLVTLGDGVNKNANESTVAIGKMYNTSTADFEVYALTHPDLAVDYRFKANGNKNDLTVDVTVNSVTSDRMALVYNGCQGTGTAYPRPIFSARYTSDTNVEMERRYSGQEFPAWVQGIDFSGIQGLVSGVAAHDPPNFVLSGDNYDLDPGESMLLTFQASVDDPLPGGITEITNTASATSSEIKTPIYASVTDPVVNPSQSSGTVGNRVWLDRNGNGVEDPGESGISGVEVALKDQYGTPVQTMLTNSTGYYLFSNVALDTGYHVDVTEDGLTKLAGLTQTTDSRTDNRTDSFDLPPTPNYRDTFSTVAYDNSDGSIDWTGTPWVENDDSGGGATGGHVRVTGGRLRMHGKSGTNNDIYRSVNIPADASSATLTFDYSFGGNLEQTGQQADLIDVEILPSGASSWTQLEHIVGEDGSPTHSASFDISSYASSDTRIRFRISNSKGYTSNDEYFYVDNFDVTYTEPTDYLDADLGYKPDPGTAIVGDLVWSDADGDGVRDPGEPGLPNVTVRLYTDINGNGVIDGGDTSVKTTTTGADGSYLFTGVTASGTEDYIVWVDQTDPDIAAYDITTPPSGEHSLINVAAGGSYLNADFGFVQKTAGTTYGIKDRVWLDNGAGAGGINDDGLQNGTEPGISGVTVDLLDGSQNVIASATTDSNGDFTFSGVPAGVRYTWRITDQAGVLSSYYGTTSSAQSGSFQMPDTLDEADDVADGTNDDVVEYNDPSNPAGYRPHFGYNVSRSLGDTVFNDNGAGGGNAGNGIQDGTESGISGVTVTLYQDVDADGNFEPGSDDGTSLGSIVTDANGKYLFSGLSDGGYWVSIDDTQSALSGFTLTSPDDDSSAAGHQQLEQISGGVSNFNADFGYQAPNPGSLSGTIWEDYNSDGNIDASETRLAGVTVDLIRDNVVITTAITDASGNYVFTGLVTAAGPGVAYTVHVTDTSSVLDGYTPTYEKTGGTSGPFNGEEDESLTPDENVSDINFGYFKPNPTYVLVSAFTAYSSNGSVVVQWETAAEIGTRGFYLERKDDAGNFVKVNKKSIPSVIMPSGGIYACLDPSAQPGGAYTYQLKELQATGGKRICGPYTVTIPKASQSSDRSVLSVDSGDSGVPGDLMESDLMKNGYARRPRGMDRIVYDPSRKDASNESKPMKIYTKSEYTQTLKKSGVRTTLAVDDSSTYDEIKIEVSKPGLYWISADKLSEVVGADEETIRGFIGANQIRMSNKGRQVDYLPAADNSGLYFYGEPYSSIYTDENVYWLAFQPGAKGDVNRDGTVDMADLLISMNVLAGNTSDLRSDYSTSDADVNGNNRVDLTEVLYIISRVTSYRQVSTGTIGNVEGDVPTASGEGKTFTATAHFEKDTWYASDVDIATTDFWFWEQFYSGAPLVGSGPFSIDVPDVATGSHEATITVNLQGLSEDSHQVNLTLNAGTENEVPMGNVAWSGLGAKSKAFVINQQFLFEGEHTHTITVQGVNNGDAEALGLDSFDLSYQKTYMAIDNSLMCNASDNDVITISGFTDADIALFDISDPLHPKRVSNAVIDSENFTITFVPAGTDVPYLAVGLDSLKAPEKAPDDMLYDVPSDLKNKENAAQYLVITADDLAQGAQDLAAYRHTPAGGGLSTMVVNLTDVFDQFSNGLYDPFAIRDFIAYAYTSWASAPQYVVLVGSGTYDFKHVLEQYDIHVDNLMPVVMINTPYGIYGSDILYGDVDGDNLLDVALGRIPAKTNDEVEAVLSKIMSYESSFGADKHVIMLADNPDASDPDSDNYFPGDSDTVATLVSDDYTVAKIYHPGLSDAEMRNQFVTGVNDGAFLVNYIGHGGYDRMSKSFFTTGNQDLLQNSQYPVFVALTCLVGGFDFPQFDSLGEVLMLKAGAGSIATWAPNGLSINSEAVKMNQALFTAIFTDKVGDLGHAINRALELYLEGYKDSGPLPYPYIIRIYNLLGDPALKVN